MSSTRQNVLEYLATFLKSEITAANGYNNNVGTVARGLRYPEEMADDAFPSVLITSSDEQRDNITRIQFKAAIRTNFVAYVKSPDGVSGVQQALDKFIEDVTRAIEKDRTQGGRVHWTTIERIRTDDGDLGSHGAAVIEVNFTYASTGTQP